MKDETLTTTLTSGFPLEINFTSAAIADQETDAATILCDIAENQDQDFQFTLRDETGRDYPVTAYGRDAVSVVLEYFSDDSRQEILREAANAASPRAEEWLRSLSWYDPEWQDD